MTSYDLSQAWLSLAVLFAAGVWTSGLRQWHGITTHTGGGSGASSGTSGGAGSTGGSSGRHSRASSSSGTTRATSGGG